MVSDIAHAAASEATTDAARVTLYDEGGRAIIVPAADAEHWLERGFLREPADTAALVTRAQLLCDEVARAYMLFITSVERDGSIDTGDAAELAAAQHGLQQLLDAVALIERAVAARYPVRQAAPVRMHQDGTTIEVDPEQVALYAAQGWEPVR
jgi:hypothetical protein